MAGPTNRSKDSAEQGHSGSRSEAAEDKRNNDSDRSEHDSSEDDKSRDKDKDKDSSDDSSDEKHEDKDKPSVFKKPIVRIGLVVLVIAIIVGCVIWWSIARQYEDTDDAFIDSHIVHVSPQIGGRILRVTVNDNEYVRRGQLLAEIDSADARAQLATIQAQKEQALTQVQQAESTEEGAAAQAATAARDLARYRDLQRTTPNAVAQQQVDQAVAAARNSKAQRDAARAQIAGALAQIRVLDAQTGQANLTLGYTKVVASEDGHIAQKTVAVGNYVTPGQELMSIVPATVWVTANFKETQLELMRVGQSVDVTIDSCGYTIPGHINSIQRGAGQAFGILPPENATGNYVKVVQRVPVKILLDRPSRECVLGVGMSVVPKVKVR